MRPQDSAATHHKVLLGSRHTTVQASQDLLASESPPSSRSFAWRCSVLPTNVFPQVFVPLAVPLLLFDADLRKVLRCGEYCKYLLKHLAQLLAVFSVTDGSYENARARCCRTAAGGVSCSQTAAFACLTHPAQNGRLAASTTCDACLTAGFSQRPVGRS